MPKRSRATATEVVVLIENFLDGAVGDHDWDDFESIPLADPILEDVRKRCAEIPIRFPSAQRHAFASPDGLESLRQIAKELRKQMPDVETARQRARTIALRADALCDQVMSSEAFWQAIESEDYDNPYVSDLLYRIEHQPLKKGFFGISTATQAKRVATLKAEIARVLTQTADAAV